jgi:hypothetical protein
MIISGPKVVAKRYTLLPSSGKSIELALLCLLMGLNLYSLARG